MLYACRQDDYFYYMYILSKCNDRLRSKTMFLSHTESVARLREKYVPTNINKKIPYIHSPNKISVNYDNVYSPIFPIPLIFLTFPFADMNTKYLNPFYTNVYEH